VSGEVVATRVKARTCEFGSISGGVALTDATCERAVVKTIAGDLGFSGPLEKGGRYEFKSHSGNVRLLVDGRTGFELQARSFSGTLRSELPLESRDSASRGRTNRQDLRGVYGDGTAEILVTTFSGDVTLAKR
jgi:DUF4097 and DUF4098 domain-containing protein YvlB